MSRPTLDIDLAGRTQNELEHIHTLIVEVGRADVEPDGIEFTAESVVASSIREDAEYEGVRVRFHATVAKARVPMQVDIGFGDEIVPGPADVEYPTLLDFPVPALRAYSRETVVAEKLEALTTLGLLNSRLKDYYDVALLARTYPFNGQHLVDAISATFRQRPREIDPEPQAPIPTTLVQAVCIDTELYTAFVV